MMAQDPSFAPKASDLIIPRLAPPGVSVYPSPGQGMALTDTGRIPEPVENARIRMVYGANQHTSGFTTTGAAYAATSETQMGRIKIVDALSIYQAGFRPQASLCGLLTNGGANTTSAIVSIWEFAVNDSSLVEIGSGADISHIGATNSFEHSAWTEIAVTPSTDPHWAVVLKVAVSAGTGTYNDMYISFRWA